MEKMTPFQFTKKFVVAAIAIWIAAAILAGQTVQADDYDDFNDFCVDNYGAELEELVYEMFGQDLQVKPAGDWTHISEKSAVICWETNLPAKTKVEYGTTTSYGESTEVEGRHFYIHVHYLTDCDPNTLYHYKLVSTDERLNTIESEDRTFTTAAPGGVVRVPDDLVGSTPYTLDQDDAYYLLTGDITAPSTVFNISADNATLDLGGHTIIYDNEANSPDPIPSGSWGATQGPCGIRTANGKSTRIVNGIVKQGLGNGASDPSGCNPVFLYDPDNTEVAGVTVEYKGAQISGIVFSYYCPEGNHAHHNVVIDRGTEILDRHIGLDGIYFSVGTVDTISHCHHNLIKRTRHRGIRIKSNTNVYSNEIYVDSWATNSYGVMYYTGSQSTPIHDDQIFDNRIFGTGFHPVGIGIGNYVHDVNIFSNYIQMQGQAPSTYRWPEGPFDPCGQEHPVNGIRCQGTQQNIHYYDNILVSKARGIESEGVLMRCLWMIPHGKMENIVVENNILKQVAQNEYASGYAVAALGGDSSNPEEQIFYYNNTIMANTCCVRFGDNYAHGANHHFIGNTFTRIGADSRYNTIKFGWMGWAFDSYGHTFLDSEFEDGAGYDVRIDGAASSYYDFTVKWTLVLKTCPCADVLIKDLGNNVVFQGEMPPEGELEIPLNHYLYTNSGNTYYTPHTVIVTNQGQEPVETVVTMDHRQSLEVCQSGGEANLNGDCQVDAADFAILSSHWHQADCNSQNDWCDGADMSGDGVVDYNDLRVLRGNWLNGTLAIELAGNLNCDCVVDFADVNIMAQDWLLCDYNGVVEPDSDGLVAFYEFEGNANDSSGNALHGTLQNGAEIVADADPNRGQVLELEGNPEHVVVADDAKFSIADEITLSAWVYPLDTYSWRTILSKFTGSRKDIYWFFYTGQIGIALAGPQNDNWMTNVPVETDTWTYVAITYDGSTITMYKDGADVASINKSGALMLADASSDEPVYIGKNSYWGEYHLGRIDDVCIYDYALSDGEILYLAGVSSYQPLESVANLYDEEPPGSKVVDFKDFAVIAEGWLETRIYGQ